MGRLCSPERRAVSTGHQVYPSDGVGFPVWVEYAGIQGVAGHFVACRPMYDSSVLCMLEDIDLVLNL